MAPQAARGTQKYLSQSQHLHKMLVIKDHYEFDQKVSQDYATKRVAMARNGSRQR